MMSKKKKIAIITVSVVAGVVLIVGIILFIIFTGFWFLLPTSPEVRQLIYDEYADDTKYVTIYGTAELHVSEQHNYAYFKINLDSECLQTHTQYQRADNTYLYDIDSVNNDYLKTTDFYESLTEFEIDDSGEKIYQLNGTVTLIVNESIWWDGDKPNLVSFDVNGITYLDYETGKSNLLYYVKNVMY